MTDVRRRFGGSVQNFWRVYRSLFNSWTVFDTSIAPPTLIAKKEEGGKLTVENADMFAEIVKNAER